MANGYPDFGPDFTGDPANDNNPPGGDPLWGDTDLPDWAGRGRGFAPPVRQPFKPRIVPPSSEPDPRFVPVDPNQVQSTPGAMRSSLVRSILGRLAPWAGRLGGAAGAYFGSTEPTASDDFNRSPHFSDPRLRRAFPEQRPSTVQDPYLGPVPYQTAPLGPGSPEARPSTVPDPYLGPAPYQTAPLLSPAGIGQGPFAGRPDIGAGIGQGPFAGRPDILRNGPGDRPSGVPPTYAPAVPPVRPRDAAAAQKPNLGYYGQTNLDPLGRGGRRWGGPLDAPQSTAFDLSKLFQGQPQ
jgi:hypothetical protein